MVKLQRGYGKSTEELEKIFKNIFEASKFTRKEKIKILLIKVFLKWRMKSVCKNLYGFKYRNQNKMFKRLLRDSYSEGIVLNNLADFHLICITKCDIWDNDWRNFLSENGKAK